MGTATGLTAERMLEIEAESVVNANVVGDNLILTKHDGTTLGPFNVRGLPGSAGPPGDFTADLPAFYEAQRLDRTDVLARQNGAEKAKRDRSDSVEYSEPWANTAGVLPVTNGQVNAGRWYALNATVPGGWNKDVSSYALDTVPRWRLSTLYYHKAGGAASAYFGLNSGVAGKVLVANDPDTMAIGVSSGNARSWIMGTNLTTGGVTYNAGAVLGAEPTVDTIYSIVIEADPVWITFSIKQLGSIANFRTTRVLRSQLVTAGKTINNFTCYFTDARALSGSSFAPWILQVGTLQRARTKTISSQVIDGADFTVRWMDEAGVITNPGEGVFFMAIPADYDARIGAPFVQWLPQSVTGAGWDPWEEARINPVTQALLSAGYIVAGANNPAGGDLYGNAASLARHKALYKYMIKSYNVTAWFLYGASMGGLDAANIIGRREFPTPAAAAIVGGAYDIGYIWDLGSFYRTAIEAAYSSSGRVDTLNKSAGFDPIRRAGRLNRGVPWRLYSSAGDTIQPIAGQNAMKDIVLPYATEATVVSGSGGHLDPSQYQASDVLAFFEKYRY